ncbi:hypothetical protein ACVWXM_007789 [Bradyrhizobium sp. GM7.3]
MAKTASKPIRASSSAAAVLADSIDDAAFATTLAKGLVVLEAFKARERRSSATWSCRR